MAQGTYTAPTPEEIAAAKAAGTQKATIETGKGTITLELYGSVAPLTVANFVKLAKAGYYDGLTFHRVENNPGFQLIQGGSPHGDGMGGPGYAIKLEIAPSLRHDTGAIAMARTNAPDSAGAQFYITFCPIPFLDDKYAVFGKVTDGLEVVKQIKPGDAMTKVTIE